MGFRENIELSDKLEEVSDGFQSTSGSFMRFKKVLYDFSRVIRAF